MNETTGIEIFPPSKELNKKRAAAAKKAVYEHLRAKKDRWDCVEYHITDLITDLLHLAKIEGINAEILLDRSLNHFIEETPDAVEDI